MAGFSATASSIGKTLSICGAVGLAAIGMHHLVDPPRPDEAAALIAATTAKSPRVVETRTTKSIEIHLSSKGAEFVATVPYFNFIQSAEAREAILALPPGSVIEVKPTRVGEIARNFSVGSIKSGGNYLYPPEQSEATRNAADRRLVIMSTGLLALGIASLALGRLLWATYR